MKTILYPTAKTLLLLTFLIYLTPGYAQAPEKMSYQAVIRNASNTLVTNQPIGMRVSILYGSPSGKEVYKEIHNPNPITNINGLVTLEIGTGIPVRGTFASIEWSAGPYFIKIETDPAGGTDYTIIGTSQLMSVPYALYAKNSGSPVWSLNGNFGTNSTTNFIGTIDDKDVVFKRNNIEAGRLNNSLENTSFGVYTLYSNTTGSSNTAIGDRALESNNSGTYNTAIGAQVLTKNTTGSYNTAVGRSALYENITGVNNTAFGLQGLAKNTTGNSNTAVGMSALLENISGSGNTAVGTQALAYSKSNGNTAIGSNALFISTSGQANTALGVNALETNKTGSNNTSVGANSLGKNSAGNFNTALGIDALNNVTTGSNNTGVGRGATVPSATASNQVRIGNATVTYAGVQVAWTITSDEQWKENIESSALGLSFINALRPVSYVRKNDKNKTTEYGFIGQELEKTLAEFNVTNSGIINKDDEGMLSVRYNDLLAPMVKAIQELKAENKKLKAQNNWAESEIKNIKSSNDLFLIRLEKLEQALMKTAE